MGFCGEVEVFEIKNRVMFLEVLIIILMVVEIDKCIYEVVVFE